MTVAVVLVIAFAGLFALAWHERKVAYAEILDFKDRNWPFSASASRLRQLGSSLAMVGAMGVLGAVAGAATKAFVEFGEAMARVSMITGLTGDELKKMYDDVTKGEV